MNRFAVPRRPLFAEGRPVRLGARLGGGGEGEVFAVARAPALAAKLYAPASAAAREGKIEAMARAGLADAAPLVAFPRAALRDGDGRFAGFLMTRVAGAHPLHELYAPGARKRAFPEADFRFLVRAAANAARAVAGAHRAGCVIGDVNHSGFLIGADALVALIDADSFQVRDGATLHLCRVGVPEYTPPELQGRPLAGVARTADHDAFGLAVVLFQLLFLGRHPFAGVSAGADLAPEEAIAAGAFAWSRRPGPLSPPPGAPRPTEVPAEVAALFEAAFDPAAAGRRPTAGAWVAALERFEAALVPCAAVPRHWHASPGGCPWCRIEAGGRARLFPAPGEPGAAPPPVDGAALAARLSAVRLPDAFAYVPPEPLPSSVPPPLSPRRRVVERLYVAMLAVMMGCAAALVWVSPQNFLMATPICLYGWGKVRDALAPRRAALRTLERVDRDLRDVIADVQRRADLDAAWLLRAELRAAVAAARRGDGARLGREIARLEAMAERLAAAATARDPGGEALAGRRAALVRDAAALGLTPPPPPAVPPRPLREATRRRVAAAG
jgi:DNA-binding helix-hairpin-helix protein with protein kinase domain